MSQKPGSRFKFSEKVARFTRSGTQSENKEGRKSRDEIARVLADIEENRNHSWYEELYQRNKDSLEDTALFYRGKHVSYGKMFEEMQRYARAMRALGLHEGSEIPICLANIPELVYLLGAASIIGAKANIFSAGFDSAYITEIIDSCSHNALFILDNAYAKIKNSVDASRAEKIVMVSLVDSLPEGKNPYEAYDKKHGLIRELRAQYIGQDDRIISPADFIALGDAYEGDPAGQISLDDEFIITYTSGSTNSSRPRAIVHQVRNMIAMGRFMDPDVESITMAKHYTYLALIPPHSFTDISASISSALMLGLRLDMEPIYDKDFFIDALQINKPTCVLATRSFWLHAAKKVLYTSEYVGIKLPFILVPFSVGEPLEINEERLLNRFLRRTKVGTELLPLPFTIITMSVAGGDCEHGSLFFGLFRALRSKTPFNLAHGHEQGLISDKLVEVTILDPEGRPCAPYQLGRLAANSMVAMKGYRNAPEATAAFFIKDADGKTWGDCNVYAFQDTKGNYHMKGRISDHYRSVPLFRIADEILKDRKHILSCEVVRCGEQLVAHVEFQGDVSCDREKVLAKANARCRKAFGEEIPELLWRVRSTEESFPLTGSGKRNAQALIAEGTANCIRLG